MTVWVSKENFTIRKALYFDLNGAELKTLTVKNIKLLDPAKKRYRAMYMEMKNSQNKRRSVFESSKIEFSANVKDDYFNTSYLQR